MLQDLQKAGKMSGKVERESSVALYAAQGSRCAQRTHYCTVSAATGILGYPTRRAHVIASLPCYLVAVLLNSVI